MEFEKNNWNEVFVNEWRKYFEQAGQKPDYWSDDWLTKFVDSVEPDKKFPVIDLGCGFGGAANYLSNKGFKVIACDFSEEAIKRVKELIPKIETRIFNMLDGLPFEENSAQMIIADLSIHYFNRQNTIKIIDEIKRVLVDSGMFLCRVNSTSDEYYRQSSGIEIEKNYFDLEGKAIRLFDKADLEELFSSWKINSLVEYEVSRYRKQKTLWELCAVK